MARTRMRSVRQGQVYPDAMAADSEPGTPQAAAVRWVEAVMERGDLAEAWPLTDPTLRLVLAQDWVWNHRHELSGPHGSHGSQGSAEGPEGPGLTLAHHSDWDAIAQGLADSPSTSELWDRFAGDTIGLWQQVWRGFSPRTSVSEEPEVLDLDMEMVTFLDSDGGSGATGTRPGRTSLARRFAMIHTEGRWLVASIGDQVFRPGWPPTRGQQAEQA